MAHKVRSPSEFDHFCTDEPREISYQIRYAEENHRSPDRPWSVRQTGVYHHHSANDEFDLFILLHPIKKSLFENQVTSLAMMQSHQTELASLVENPYRMHIMPFALYLDNWRWCFRYLGEEFQDKVSYSLIPWLSVAKTILERPSHDSEHQNIGRSELEI